MDVHEGAVFLTNAFGTSDAEDGFNACSACCFENLKRCIFCSLCGSIVDAAASQSAHTEGKDKLFAQQQLASARDNHRRKARALYVQPR
jgi:hypothetical protein